MEIPSLVLLGSRAWDQKIDEAAASPLLVSHLTAAHPLEIETNQVEIVPPEQIFFEHVSKRRKDYNLMT